MADPTDKVRRGVRERDGERCVACGTMWAITFQHRRAVGMGGSKERPGYADGLAACADCNARFEGNMQTLALLNGWKVRRWVQDPSRVPYFHVATGRWYALAADGPWRREISRAEAVRMMNDVYAPDPRGPEAVAA
ncbi:hypothetical protein [Agrococcus casei]|uniref:HNH endonuclease n=1 Tax=Agrococcus casei LMG 22410 TaxID=1255656 RepID=A0A1R4FGF5_9MICO|nr:hypothetical protein [Agrococcus casei]SJM54911.1 hypothetical protein CZ674_04380 [Agrococcus casei LMG 22410]